MSPLCLDRLAVCEVGFDRVGMIQRLRASAFNFSELGQYMR